MSNLTQSRVRSLLDYDEATGVVRWRVSKGCAKKGSQAGCDSQGYIDIRVDGEQHRIHRVIFFYMTGRWPIGIDHINGIRSDNRWHNLREASQAENGKNCARHSHNRSGTAGVFWNTNKRKWTAKIKVNQRSIHLGHFDRKADAARARKQAEIKYGFSPRHGTDPEARRAA